MAFRQPGYGIGVSVGHAGPVRQRRSSCGSTRCRATPAGTSAAASVRSFSQHPTRYKLWKFVTPLNAHHMRFAWISLVLRRPDRPVRAAGGERDDPRPGLPLLGWTARTAWPTPTDTRRTTTTSSSSAPAAPGCGPRSRPSERGLRTALVCKSLLGKAHTVMAEGGMAAAMGNVWPEDNWQVHFRDTMRGGKMLNNWRMAQLHAQEAPDRVYELERWGALFDRTPDGRITQRDFGGHRYARLAHVGDRTGLELIRTLQQKVVSTGSTSSWSARSSASCTTREGRVSGAVGLLAPDRRVRRLHRQGRRPGHRRRSASRGSTPPTRGSPPATATPWPSGPAPTSSTWSACSSTRPGWCGRCRCAASWSPRGSAATAACCATPRASASCSTTSPTCSAAETADTEEEADALVRGPQQQPAHARAAAPRRGGPADQLRGEGGPGQPARRRLPRHRHAAARPSTSGAGCRRCTTSSWSWPAWTSPASPMEVGPTCHYMMGGVARRRRDRGGHGRRASSPPARWRAACTAPTAWAATRSRTCSSSAGGPGMGAAEFAEGRAGAPSVDQAEVAARSADDAWRPSGSEERREPLRRAPRAAGDHADAGRHHPHRVPSSRRRWPSSRSSSERAGQGAGEGGRAYNPGWNLATDLPSMLTVSDRRGPGRAASARRAEAGTPGRTTRGRTPSWARSTSSQRIHGRRATRLTCAPIAIARPSRMPEMPRRADAPCSRKRPSHARGRPDMADEGDACACGGATTSGGEFADYVDARQSRARWCST